MSGSAAELFSVRLCYNHAFIWPSFLYRETGRQNSTSINKAPLQQNINPWTLSYAEERCQKCKYWKLLLLRVTSAQPALQRLVETSKKAAGKLKNSPQGIQLAHGQKSALCLESSPLPSMQCLSVSQHWPSRFLLHGRSFTKSFGLSLILWKDAVAMIIKLIKCYLLTPNSIHEILLELDDGNHCFRPPTESRKTLTRRKKIKNKIWSSRERKGTLRKYWYLQSNL